MTIFITRAYTTMGRYQAIRGVYAFFTRLSQLRIVKRAMNSVVKSDNDVGRFAANISDGLSRNLVLGLTFMLACIYYRGKCWQQHQAYEVWRLQHQIDPLASN